MNADRERQLAGRAAELEDTSELAETVTAILGGARAARLDPDALGGLTGAALALGADARAVYRAGARRGGAGARLADDRAFVSAVADAEDDIAEHRAAAARLAGQAAHALEDAENDLDRARLALVTAMAMPEHRPCTGCHSAKAAAIAAARERISACMQRAGYAADALAILGPLTTRLQHALTRIRAVPADLGETYEAVYRLIRRGGAMPYDGDWITPAGPGR